MGDSVAAKGRSFAHNPMTSLARGFFEKDTRCAINSTFSLEFRKDFGRAPRHEPVGEAGSAVSSTSRRSLLV